MVTFSGCVCRSHKCQRQGERGSSLRHHQDVRRRPAQRPAAVLRRGRQPPGQAGAGPSDGRRWNQIDQNLRRDRRRIFRQICNFILLFLEISFLLNINFVAFLLQSVKKVSLRKENLLFFQSWRFSPKTLKIHPRKKKNQKTCQSHVFGVSHFAHLWLILYN